MYLDKIISPKDIKRIPSRELTVLAEEVRKRIVEVTAKNGGHLAPSLGATDFTIALLKVFSPLKDRFVWDVGHQSYAYKILTERNKKFDTLREYKGLGGFNNPDESEYDAFRVGHASTSISAALGIQVAKDYKNEKGRSIAIIGDGALTGGMAFEALNHAGHIQKNMIVILNDNKMSISKNVGGLQNYLTNMLVSRSYNSLKRQVWDASNRLPGSIRKKFIYGAQKLEESLINILVPNIIFEDLGFKYVGPIDGHDIPRMIRIFNKVKMNIDGPILIHLVTQKGKGCDFAETNATKYHGTGPYFIETGESIGLKSQSYSSVFGNSLMSLAKENDNVCTITAAMCDGTGLSKFAKEFPDRFYDVGIAEQHAVTYACGLATQGLKPFVAIYSTFMQRAIDQVIHDAALQRLPIVICMDRAGLVGADGPTHHGTFDLSFLSYIPGLTIMAPSNAGEFRSMMNFSAKYYNGPIAIRYPRGAAEEADYEVGKIELGKSLVRTVGKKIVILGIGTGVNIGVELSKLIEEKYAIKCELTDIRFLKPLDEKLLEKYKSNDFEMLITIEENSVIGGLGSIISQKFVNEKQKVFSYGIPDQFVAQGTQKELLEEIGLTAPAIFVKLEKELDQVK